MSDSGPRRPTRMSTLGRLPGQSRLNVFATSISGRPKPELRAFLTSLHVLLHPFVDHAGNVEIILLNHHHMAVAADASVLQANILGLYTGLVEVLRRAVI